MSLVSLRDISFAWSGPPLLDGVSLEIARGERIGLLGRNGAGKTTMMKIVAKELEPDNGTVKFDDGVRVGRLVQDVPDGTDRTVSQIVAAGLADNQDAQHDWQAEQAIDRVLTRMSLNGDAQFSHLSSGMKRRTLLAQALVREPDLLLLDEPTNHLDIDSITWLERFLKGYSGALLFVTHDRAFLQALADRIIEVDRGRLFDWTCDYATFLKRRAAALHAEEQQNAAFDQKLAEEEVWIRQGIKARRTRNEGRVRALKKMREERRLRRERMGSVRMQTVDAEKSGQMVLELKHVCFAYDSEPMIDDLSLTISRGDKIGIIGPNGAGKSTLLKLLLDQLQPTSGAICHGTRLKPVYFDQLREQIDETKTVVENVGEGQEILEINGKRQHIYGYLQDFLFTPERARRPARYLSGGERNRLMLARLFKRPSNLLILDEPTNDLDAETLELLEELVVNYEGTVLLVSHDRAFLNNVATSTLVFEGQGRIREYDGGYDDYLRQRPEPTDVPETVESKPKRRPAAAPQVRKLSYHERRELEELPATIERLEQEQAELHQAMTDPEFFRQDSEQIAEATARVEKIGQQLADQYARWEELSELE